MGDGHADVLGRLASDGSLYQYRGRADGGLSAGQPVGAGWKQHDMIVGVGDFDGDDHADLLARQAATGDLWLYRGNGDGGFLSKVKIGAVGQARMP